MKTWRLKLSSYGRSPKEFWERSRWLRVIAYTVLAAIIALAIFGDIPTQRSDVWSVETLDRVVIVTLAFMAGLVFLSGLLSTWSSPKISGRALKRGVIRGGGAILLGLTLYATYGAFRNQSRLTAEQNLNSEAMQLYQLEIDNPELRCLYYNYGHTTPGRCLANLISTEEKWSLAIFYVEEVWFVLAKAETDEREWGSTYSETINWWRVDVARDPTGIFSYYVVAGEWADEPEGAVQRARDYMASARVDMKYMCRRYHRVWEELRRSSAQPPPRAHCPPEPLPIQL